MNRIAKIVVCFFAVILFACAFRVTAEAALVTGTCGSGLSWSYENETLRIYGNGRMNDYSSSGPWSHYESIKNVIIEEGVTYIGAQAFYEMASIKTVTLPDTLTEIGYAAFCWCENLESIDIPGSVKVIGENAFWCCLDLTEVTFHEGLVEIKDEAFVDCRLITRIEFPESLEKIGYWAFGSCSDLTYVSMPGVKDLGPSCFSACTKLRTVKLGKELEDIKSSTFANCYELFNITIPGSVDSIEDTAFYLCSALGKVKFAGSLPEISDSAFLNATGTITYPECNTEWEYALGNNYCGTLSWQPYSVDGHVYSETVVEPTCLRWGYTCNTCTDCDEYYMDEYYSALGHSWDGGTTSGSITSYVCQRCGLVRNEYNISGSCGSGTRWELDTEEGILYISGTGSISNKSGYEKYKDSIIHVVIEPGVTMIGAEAFFEFGNIESIEIPETVTYIGESAFVWCEKLKEVIVPEGVAHIYNSTFWGCQSMETLVLPSTLKSIGEEVFYKCDSLKYLYIPDSVTSVGELAFWYCRGLEEVNIPKGLKELSKDMFTTCTSLKKVTIPYGIEVIGEDAFDGCSSLSEIVIPDSVHTINDTAFWGCTSLKKIVIPGSLMNFGYMVFGNCTKLSEIKFTGNPPAFDGEAFKNLSTKVLYRSGNSAWTSSVRQQYGGSITWKSYSEYDGTHSYSSSVKVPTCTQWGYTKYTCSSCDEYYMANYTEATGHDWELSVEGSTISTYICNNCGETKEVRELSGSCGSNLRWRLNTEEGILRISGTGNMSSMGRDSQPWSSYKDCITKVIIESGATSIGSYAFYEHPNLVSVEVPSTIRSIGLGAFAWSELLESITIPEGVTSIPEDCFWACTGLKTINLPSTIKTIGQGAFYYTAISSIYLADGITDIGEDAFWYCKNLGSVTIPKNVKILRETVFSSCENLKSVKLHDDITEIQRSAFSHCGKLTSIVLPKKLEIIGVNSFVNTGISKITIPENVSRIDGYVFGESLYEVHFLGNAPEMDAKAFNGLYLTAYYPENSPSWTSEVRTNYGGTISWRAEECRHLLIRDTITEPLCDDEGYTEHTCEVCGYYYYDTYTAALGHTFTDWYVYTDPEGIEPSEERRDCERCDYYESRPLPGENPVFGDINLDGNVDVMDAYYARLVAAKLVVPTEEQLLTGDVDGDGKITAVDANYIRKFSAKIIQSFPVEQ